MKYDSSENKKMINFYENKYGYSYEQFCLNFHNIDKQMFEKENDSMDWEVRITLLNLKNDK